MVLVVLITICGWLGALGGSAEMFGIAAMGTGVLVMYCMRESAVNNYRSPKGIDGDRMMRDRNNGASTGEVKNKMLRGEYDKK